MVETIFTSVYSQTIFIFLLVFVVVFAILQKTKVLGDGKKQIDALVALAVALLVLSAGFALSLFKPKALYSEPFNYGVAAQKP